MPLGGAQRRQGAPAEVQCPDPGQVEGVGHYPIQREAGGDRMGQLAQPGSTEDHPVRRTLSAWRLVPVALGTAAALAACGATDHGASRVAASSAHEHPAISQPTSTGQTGAGRHVAIRHSSAKRTSRVGATSGIHASPWARRQGIVRRAWAHRQSIVRRALRRRRRNVRRALRGPRRMSTWRSVRRR